jgi:alkanesulfonate monooxygenase SsuD/methylene tetrahydromethanopterin reductase-like flavin-dependent oxidoreductase (luciferase family)
MQTVAADADRSGVEWHNALNVWCGVGADADEARPFVAAAMQSFYQLPYERFERWSPAGSPAQVAEFLHPYVEAGCHTFNVIACGSSLEAEIDAVRQIRDQLLAV